MPREQGKALYFMDTMVPCSAEPRNCRRIKTFPESIVQTWFMRDELFRADESEGTTMKKLMTGALSALTALSFVFTPVSASAQDRWRDSDRDGRPDYREWNRDRDRDGRPDQYDRRDRRSDRWDRGDRWERRQERRAERRWRYYGGQHGYSGYRGHWRTGQRYPYYNSNRYWIQDYRSYDLPPPRHGYRYYRDNNGDIVMAAIASGIIGLIIGGALSDGHRGW
jgi:Ni/Co efflux regulator RcnB